MIANWRAHAILLYERWKWTPDVVENLDVEDFAFYLDQVKEIYDAEAKAIKG